MTGRRAALISVALLFAASVARTATEHLPDATVRPLVVVSADMDAVPVELPGATYHSLGGSVEVHRVRLFLPDVTAIPGHLGIRLLVATYQTNPVLADAELRLVGTRCRFVTAPGATFRDNETLTFARVPACSPLQGEPTGEADLIIRFSRGGRAVLWTWVRPAGSPITGAILVDDPLRFESPAHPLVRGDYIDAFARSKTTRVQLLAYMWQFSRARQALVALGFAGTLLVIVAATVWPLTASSPWRAGLAAGSLLAGLGILYSAFIPPFQAPDEPSHFLGILYSLDGQRHDPEVQIWAQRAHFESLRFDGGERFRPSDLGRPEPQEWRAVPPTWFSTRTNLVFVWRAAAYLFHGWPLQALLLGLRVTHAVLLGTAVMIGTAAVSAWCRRPHGWRALTPLWTVPSIPFLGMHVSNYALVLPGYVLVAAGAAVLLTGGRNAWKSGVLLGTGFAIAASGSRSALPLLPLLAALVSLRFVTPAPGIRTHALAFWGGLSLGILGLFAPVGTIDVSGASIFVLPVGGAVAVAAMCVGDLRRAVPSTATTLTNGGRFAALAGAIAIVASLVGSLLIDYPVLETVSLSAPPPIARYLGSATLSALTWPRLRHHDFLLSTSFWGAFGWLDRLLPEWAITVCVTASSVAVIALLVSASRRRDAVLMKSLAVIALGAVASFLAYVVVTLKTSPDVHGRYLLGLYLCVLVVISTVSVSDDSPGSGGWRNAMHVGIPILGHALTFAFVISRYF